jgi:hypothetical protein
MSYSNFYNSYRYGNNNNERNSGDNFADNRQPVQPPQGYVEATYSWNNQSATPGLENQQVHNPKVYSNNNDAYSRPQDTSSSFAHLPTALGSYNQAVRTEDRTQRPSGLNSLVYASTLESGYKKNPGISQPTKTPAQTSTDSPRYQNTAPSYNYPSQSSAPNQAANSGSSINYNQQPQRSSSAASQTTASTYTHSNSSAIHDTARKHHTQPTHMSQPERRPSPKVTSQAKAPRRGSNYKSPPNSHASTSAPLNAPVYPQAPQGYGAFAANASSAVSHQHPQPSTEPTATGISRTQTPPTVAQTYTRAASDNDASVTSSSGMETRAPNQISPSKVQYINPTDLYTQQYFLAQERTRAAETEAMAEEKRRNEAEAQSQAEAVARAVEAAAATTNAPVAPTNADKEKSTKTKPAKNSAKKRSSAKKKVADKEVDPTEIDLPEAGDDMASEMRLMLEKLRGMRTKDPTLFSRLWDDFKKVPPSNQAAPAHPGPSPAATSDQPLTGLPATETPDSESLPDLGKFPALRRRRNRKSDNPKLPPNPQSNIPATPEQVKVDSMLNQQPASQPPLTTFNAQHATSTAISNNTAAEIKQTNATPKPQAKTNPGQDATWPVATQQKLAQAASEYLGNDPANQGKQCSPESLMLLLRNNPTYPDLCSQLESRGFALDRQAMAKFLLSSVPTLASGNNGQKTEVAKTVPAAQVAQSLPLATTQPMPQPMPPQPNGATGPILPPTAPSLSNAPARDPQQNAFTTFKPHAPMMTQLDLNTSVATVVPLPEQKKREEKSKSLARPRKSGGQFAAIPVIGPKAEMSRKRLFSEIVDMTQLSSDEEDDDPYPGRRESSHFDLTVGGQPGFPRLSQDAMDLDSDSPHPTEHDDLSDSRTAREADMAQPDIEYDPDDEFVLESIKKLHNLAKPMNPSDALNRVYYNPKSIARDIMLATGRHPSERPLNYHLLKFTQTFAGVSTKSDFKTFRWDLVDPGGPSMPVVELEDILVEPPQITPKRRRRRDASRDAEDAKGPTSDSQAGPSFPPAPAPASVSVSVSLSTPQAVRNNPMAGTPVSGQRSGRRGRPPGAKNKKPTKAALKAVAATTTAASPAKTVRIAGPDPTLNVPEPSYPVFTCEWGSCPSQLHDFHTLERHVSKVHLPGQKTCQWQGCPNSTTEYSDEALKDHLAKAHIQPLAWKYGDGPSVNGTGEKAITSPVVIDVS